jgi:putative spermidine/putrescine transport system substrate-binding protein
VLANLPTSPQNAKTALQFNVKFWADQGEELEKRFAAWATQ